MRLLLQKVTQSTVQVDETTTGAINKGLLVFLGIHKDDTEIQIDQAITKLLELRLFPDSENEKYFDVNIAEWGGDILVVSQFTLYGSLNKGRRPGFDEAASPEVAEKLYEKFVETLKERFNGNVETGKFQAHMQVSLTNDGPVTFILDI